MKKKIYLMITLFLAVMSMCGCSSDFGAKMAKAGLNTLMGMGTVFVMLIFIAFIISLFKYVSKFEGMLRNREDAKEAKKAAKIASAPAEPVQAEPEEAEDETDDLELVAVITAALAASLGTSPDGLVVRSIRRKNSNRW